MANFRTFILEPKLGLQDFIVLDAVVVVTFSASVAEANDAAWFSYPLAVLASVWPLPLVFASRWRGLMDEAETIGSAMRLAVGMLLCAYVSSFAEAQGQDFRWASLILLASGIVHLALDSRVGEPAPWTRHVLALCFGMSGAIFGLVLVREYQDLWPVLAMGFYGFSVSFVTRYPVNRPKDAPAEG